MTDEWNQGEAETDFAFSGESVTVADLATREGTIDKCGKYHFEVVDVVEDLNTLADNGNLKSPSIRFDLMVLHTVQGQSPQGTRHFHRIWLAGKGGEPAKKGAVASALKFGMALRLLEPLIKDEPQSPVVVAGTKDTRIPSKIWRQAKGRQICAEIVLNRGEAKPGGGNYADKYEIPFGDSFDPYDPKVAEWPKSKEAMAMYPAPVGYSATPPTQKAAVGNNGQPQQQPKPRNSDVDLSDL